MTKTLFRGNETDLRRRFYERRFYERKRSREAGYALFMGAGLLFLISVSFISAAALFRTKTESLEKQRLAFYEENIRENERILSEWNNGANPKSRESE